jgi:hypothetical protein
MGAPLTPEQRAAREAERNAKEAAVLADLGAAAVNLANIRRLNLKPMHTTTLWAEWEFAKALKAWDGDGLFDDMFSEACDNLGVDEEGEFPADRGENFGASHPDAGRGFRIGGAA